MKQIIIYLLVLIFTSCIPITYTKAIQDYEIKKRKIKVFKKKEKYNEYLFETNISFSDFSTFLERKFNSRSCSSRDFCFKKVVTKNIEQQFIFSIYTKEQQAIDLVALSINKELKTLTISKKVYIGIIVKDDFNYDYLSETSKYRTELINYLSQLKNEYKNSI